MEETETIELTATLFADVGARTDVSLSEEEFAERLRSGIPPTRPEILSATSALVSAEQTDWFDGSTSTPTAISVNHIRLQRAAFGRETEARLSRIASRGDGWRGSGSRGLASGSLSIFLDFWLLVSTEAKEPLLTLMPNGNLSAQWFRSSRRNLALEFSDEGKVYFGLLDGENVIEGIEKNLGTLSRLLLLLDTRPLTWNK